MTASFDLIIDRPWIPCQFAGAAVPQDLSLRDTLSRAEEITGIVADSPLETIAIHRLLLAVLHRIFRVADDAEWTRLWEGGRFDSTSIDAWAGAWRHRFDLFHPERPFYQAPGLPESLATTVAKLGHEFSSGNNPLLFDHSSDNAPVAIPAAKAARLLVAQQAFAIGGLITRLAHDPPSAESSHLLKAAVLLVTGENLFRTLLLNMVIVDGRIPEPFPFTPEEDAPAWEQEPPVAATRGVKGYLDLLTWQARRVRLFPDEDGRVAKVAVLDGYRTPKAFAAKDYETMTAHWKREKPAAGQEPWPAIGFQREKALWRDSLALVQRNRETSHPARTVTHLADVARALEGHHTNIAAFGLSTDRAKIFLWRHEELPLPLAYLQDEDLVTYLGEGVAVADQAGSCVRNSVWLLASEVLAPDGKADKNRVSQLTDSLAPERAYWPALDVPFRRFMGDLATARASGDEECLVPKRAWGEALRRAARDAFEQSARAMETSGRGYHAAADARAHFGGRLAVALKPLLPAILAPEPEEVSP